MRIIKFFKIIFVLAFLLLEELAWNYFGKPIYDKIVSLKITIRFQKWLSEQKNEYVVLLIFLLPFVPDNLLTFYLGIALAKGMVFTVIGIYVFKAFFSIVTIIIFKISKKELVKFKIIKFGYYYLLKLIRSKLYKIILNYLKIIKNYLKEDYKEFKANYLNGDSSFKHEMKRIYIKLKRTLHEEIHIIDL